ncbi:hypothetical protein DK871_24995 [Pseudomonas sp. L13]|nr:hypothetical protein [Pseudomonas sp. L13]
MRGCLHILYLFGHHHGAHRSVLKHLQQAWAWHNNFGTGGRELIAPLPCRSLWFGAGEPFAVFLVGDSGPIQALQHPYRFLPIGLENGCHPRARFGLSKNALVQPDASKKALEFLAGYVFGLFA